MAEPSQQQTEDRRSSGAPANGDDKPAAGPSAEEFSKLQKQYGQLLNDLSREREARKKLGDELKPWQEVKEEGLDPTQVRALAAKHRDAEVQRARETGEIDKLLSNQDARHKAELERAQEKWAKERRLNEALLIDAVLDAELERYKVGRGSAGLKKAAALLHRDKMRVIDDENETHGVRTVIDIGKGELMDVGHYIKNWVENNPEAIEFLPLNQSTGGGAPGSRSAQMGLKPRSKMTPREKSDFLNARGRAAYDALPWD